MNGRNSRNVVWEFRTCYVWRKAQNSLWRDESLEIQWEIPLFLSFLWWQLIN